MRDSAVRADPTLPSEFDEALAAMAPPGIRIGHRLIQPGDESALLPEELAPLASSVAKVRRQSGAARHVARLLLAEMGFAEVSLPPRRKASVSWPLGVVGSLAHDGEVAVAAVASAATAGALGIDVEPDLPLPVGLLTRIATADERRRYDLALLESRLLFCIKEAVFKAVHSTDGVMPGFQEVEVDLDRGRAVVRSLPPVSVRFIRRPRIVTLAFRPCA